MSTDLAHLLLSKNIADVIKAEIYKTSELQAKKIEICIIYSLAYRKLLKPYIIFYFLFLKEIKPPNKNQNQDKYEVK